MFTCQKESRGARYGLRSSTHANGDVLLERLEYNPLLDYWGTSEAMWLSPDEAAWVRESLDQAQSTR